METFEDYPGGSKKYIHEISEEDHPKKKDKNRKVSEKGVYLGVQNNKEAGVSGQREQREEKQIYRDR